MATEHSSISSRSLDLSKGVPKDSLMFTDGEKMQQPGEEGAVGALTPPPATAKEEPSVEQHDVEKHGHGPVTRIATAQDWTGPDDPEDPHNWPLIKRIYATTVPAVMGFAVTLGSSIYTPGIPDIMREMRVSSTVAILGLSMWTLGLAFGPVLAAPLSETLGRSAVYRVTLPLSAIFTIGAGFAQTPTQLIVCRFFGGVFGSPVLAVGAGTNVDVWEPIHRAVATVLFIWSPFAGPALGPLIGGFAAESKGWRWTQWCLLFVNAFALVWSLPLAETHKTIILQRRAKRLGLAPPKATGPKGKAAVWFLLTVTLFRPLHMLVTEPIVAFFSLYIAFNFAVLFGFFDAFPIIFEDVYGFDRGHAGLPWLAVFLGCSLAIPTVVYLNNRFYRREHLKARDAGGNGLVAPEHRLYAAMIGSLGLPVGLFWLGWTARADIHWISPTLAAIPFAWGNLSVFVGAVLYLIDTYGPATGASALAANGLLRYTLGAVFPLFTNQMYAKVGIGWATSIFGFISVLLLPIPWILFKYGSSIRAKSRYETIKA